MKATRKKILIVDDNEINVNILEEILEDDYDLSSAYSGEEALEVAEGLVPDLVLLDVMMPGMSGYQTCVALREMDSMRHVKIIMVSAKAMVEERMQGYEAGADDYVTKPFNHDELLAKVRVYLRLKSVEEVDQLKSNILLMLSRETRTPLNGILPNLEMLLDDRNSIDESERKRFLAIAYEGARNLQRLLEQVVVLSKMRSGSAEMDFRPHSDGGPGARCSGTAQRCGRRETREDPTRSSR